MNDSKHQLLARIGHRCNQLEKIASSYRGLQEMAKKDGASQEFAVLVDAIGTVTLSNLSDAGNILEALLLSSPESRQ